MKKALKREEKVQESIKDIAYSIPEKERQTEFIRREWDVGYLKFLETHFNSFNELYGFNPYVFQGQESFALVKEFFKGYEDPETLEKFSLVDPKIFVADRKEVMYVLNDLETLGIQVSDVIAECMAQIDDIHTDDNDANDVTIAAIRTRMALLGIVEWLCDKAIYDFGHLDSQWFKKEAKENFETFVSTSEFLKGFLFEADDALYQLRMEELDKKMQERESNPATQTDEN